MTILDILVNNIDEVVGDEETFDPSDRVLDLIADYLKEFHHHGKSWAYYNEVIDGDETFFDLLRGWHKKESPSLLVLARLERLVRENARFAAQQFEQETITAYREMLRSKAEYRGEA